MSRNPDTTLTDPGSFLHLRQTQVFYPAPVLWKIRIVLVRLNPAHSDLSNVCTSSMKGEDGDELAKPSLEESKQLEGMGPCPSASWRWPILIGTPTKAPPNCDKDGDGFEKAGGACGGDDCKDNDRDINPDATEVCDGVDNNCNGQTDEGGVCGGGSGEFNATATIIQSFQNGCDRKTTTTLVAVQGKANMSALRLTGPASSFGPCRTQPGTPRRLDVRVPPPIRRKIRHRVTCRPVCGMNSLILPGTFWM